MDNQVQKHVETMGFPMDFHVGSAGSSPATWRPSLRLGVAAVAAEAQQTGDALPPAMTIGKPMGNHGETMGELMGRWVL